MGLRFSLLILLVTVSAECEAGPLPASTAERVRALSLEGLGHAYNFEFAAANERFDAAIAIEPLHPRPYVGKAEILFWRLMFSKNEAEIDSFLLISDRAISTCEKY